MQKLFFALLCLGLLGLQAPQHADAGESRSSLKVVVETSGSKEEPTVKLTVMNRSNTYQLFQSMSCSWQTFWQTDDKNARIEGPGACKANWSTTIILAPGEKYTEKPVRVLFRGAAGRRTLRFGYSRSPSDFTSDALRQISQSQGRDAPLSSVAMRAHFKPGRETFWSAPVTLTATKQSILL